MKEREGKWEEETDNIWHCRRGDLDHSRLRRASSVRAQHTQAAQLPTEIHCIWWCVLRRLLLVACKFYVHRLGMRVEYVNLFAVDRVCAIVTDLWSARRSEEKRLSRKTGELICRLVRDHCSPCQCHVTLCAGLFTFQNCVPREIV